MKLPPFSWAAPVLLATGCSHLPEPANPPAAAPVPAERQPSESPMARGQRVTAMLVQESFGPLRLNLPEREVLQTLGEPRERSPMFHVEATGLDVQEWFYPKAGLILRMASSAGITGPKFLAGIYAQRKCTFATRRGIQIGSTQADVQKAYAGTEDLQEHELLKYGEGRFIVGSIFSGIVFEFTRGKVSGIYYGAYAECRTLPATGPRG